MLSVLRLLTTFLCRTSLKHASLSLATISASCMYKESDVRYVFEADCHRQKTSFNGTESVSEPLFVTLNMMLPMFVGSCESCCSLLSDGSIVEHRKEDDVKKLSELLQKRLID
jgi:hypothetical protein